MRGCECDGGPFCCHDRGQKPKPSVRVSECAVLLTTTHFACWPAKLTACSLVVHAIAVVCDGFRWVWSWYGEGNCRLSELAELLDSTASLDRAKLRYCISSFVFFFAEILEIVCLWMRIYLSAMIFTFSKARNSLTQKSTAWNRKLNSLVRPSFPNYDKKCAECNECNDSEIWNSSTLKHCMFM